MRDFLKHPLTVVVLTQLLFTIGDLLARANMRKFGFTWQAFLTGWFALYFLIRQVAMIGQLYVFSKVELGKTMALFGACSIILANGLGFLLLKEVLSPGVYVGITLAVLGFIVLAFV